MTKGFSFVLVSVVMVVMMVFGLLSYTSSAADMRLSQKSAQTQTIYYEVDGKAEHLKAACEAAAQKAQSRAQAYMDGKGYLTPPQDIYACLQPLSAAGAAGEDAKKLLTGMYFYYLAKELDVADKTDGLTCTIDQKALAAALSGQTNGTVATVQAEVRSKTNQRYFLKIRLTAPFEKSGESAFQTAGWVFTVDGNEITDTNGDSVTLWQG